MLQGERQLARDNRTLGRFHLSGLAPAPRGVPQIEVAFDIDANGIVSVTAKDTATGKEQKITITGASGLSKDEVDRMVKEAQSHAAEDATRREFIDAKNQADSLAYQVEKTLDESREKLPVGDVAASRRQLPTSESSPRATTSRRCRRRIDDLQHAAHAIAETLYQDERQSTDRAPAEPVSPNVKDGEVVDAEYADTAH